MSTPQGEPSFDGRQRIPSPFDTLTPAQRREAVAEFRDELMAGVPEGLHVVYVQTPEVSGPDSRYGVKPLSGSGVDRLDADDNLYFCIGAVKPFIYEDSGKTGWRRRPEDVGAGLLIGFDDIGTKSSVGLDFFTRTLPPTVVVETSPDNFQVLYFFDTPILDEHEFGDVLKSIIAPLHEQYGIDKLTDTNRVLRIPWGVNSKRYDEKHEKAGQLKYPDARAKPWRVRLVSADYDARYTPQQIADAYGVKIVRTQKRAEMQKRERKAIAADDYKAFGFSKLVEAAQRAGAAKRVSTSAGEKWRISCPWADEHASGGKGDTAFVADPQASKTGHYTFYCSSATCGIAREKKERTFDAATDKAGVWDTEAFLNLDADPEMCVEAWADHNNNPGEHAAANDEAHDDEASATDDDSQSDAADDGRATLDPEEAATADQQRTTPANADEIEKAIDSLVTEDGAGLGAAIRHYAERLGISVSLLEKLIKDRRAYNGDEERRAREQKEASAHALYEQMCAVTMDLERLADFHHEPPAFVIPDWLPEGYVTLLAAHGAGGKSLISLYVAICIAMGLPVLGHPGKKQRKVLVYSCEDHMPVLNWRVQQYCAALNIESASLDGWLYVIDAGALDRPELFALPAQRGGQRSNGTTTPAYEALKKLMTDEAIDIAVIDNASDVYAANEIDRAAVSAFIRSLEHLLPNNRGAVLLLAHVNRAATNSNMNMDGQQYSGSTGWHNKVRSRLELTRGKEEEAEDGWGGPAKPYILKRAKGNYSASDTKNGITFHWNHTHSVILPDEQPTQADRAAGQEARQRDHERAVLDAFVKAHETGQRISANVKSNNNAAKVFNDMGIVLPAAIRVIKALSPVLDALKEKGLLEIEEYDDGRRHGTKPVWKLTEQGLAEGKRTPK